MKSIHMICAAAALCVPALASAQRGGGTPAVGVSRVESVQRIDTGRTIGPVRDIDLRGRDIDVARGGEVVTGTRIPHHNPARRRWNAANPPNSDNNARRRYYNATH